MIKALSLSIALALPMIMLSSYSHATNIEQTCRLSQHDCLRAIDKEQPFVRPKSFEWFRLEMYRQSSLFELERYDELIEVLSPWQNYERLPHSFALSTAIHRAKMLLMQGDKVQAHKELSYAVELLESISVINTNPMLIVVMANALMSMQELEKAYSVLLALETKYQRSPDPLLKREMYANLGHLAHRLGEHGNALDYRQKSLEGAVKVGNVQQIGIAYHNVAYSYKSNGQIAQAIEYYEKAVVAARQSMDKHTGTKAKLKLIECLIEIDEFERATRVLRSVDTHIIHAGDKAKYDEFFLLINEKSPAK